MGLSKGLLPPILFVSCTSSHGIPNRSPSDGDLDLYCQRGDYPPGGLLVLISILCNHSHHSNRYLFLVAFTFPRRARQTFKDLLMRASLTRSAWMKMMSWTTHKKLSERWTLLILPQKSTSKFSNLEDCPLRASYRSRRECQDRSWTFQAERIRHVSPSQTFVSISANNRPRKTSRTRSALLLSSSLRFTRADLFYHGTETKNGSLTLQKRSLDNRVPPSLISPSTTMSKTRSLWSSRVISQHWRTIYIYRHISTWSPPWPPIRQKLLFPTLFAHC